MRVTFQRGREHCRIGLAQNGRNIAELYVASASPACHAYLAEVDDDSPLLEDLQKVLCNMEELLGFHKFDSITITLFGRLKHEKAEGEGRAT